MTSVRGALVAVVWRAVWLVTALALASSGCAVHSWTSVPMPHPASLRLREGDVILALANVEVANIREFEAVLAKLDKGKTVNVLFRRGDWAQYAVIRPQR